MIAMVHLRRTGRKRSFSSYLSAAIVLVVSSLTIAVLPTAQAQASTVHTDARPSWVGGWEAALTSGGKDIVDQTVRTVVHTTVGGPVIRLRVSNVFGTSPLHVGAVDVAVQSSGGNAVPGSHHTVTFWGSPTTTIPVGVEAVSDPLVMPVKPEENLLVSVFYPDDTGPSNWNWQAWETSYFSAPGNFANADTTADYPTSNGSWYYVSGLDVLSGTARGTLVAFGDSITAGVASTPSANDRWPNVLARRLQALPGGPPLGVVDAGIGGNRVLTDAGPNDGVSALHRFAQEALNRPNVRSIILLEGINDIGYNAGPNGTALTAQDLIDGDETLIREAHADGVRIYGATILPDQGASYYTSAGEAIREAVNQWIRTSGAFDGVIDFDAVMRDASNPLHLNPAYDSGDHLHPNDAGYQAMGDAVDLAQILGPSKG